MFDHLTHLTHFLEMMAAQRQASENTLESYGADIREYYAFLDHKNSDVLKADTACVQGFLAYLLKDKKISPRSQARKLSSLRQFYRFLCQEGVMQENPTALIDSPVQPKGLPNVLSEEEIFLLLQYARDDSSPEAVRLYAQLELLYASGMRITELISLPMKALLVDQQGYIRDYLLVKGKGGKERIVPLNPMAIEALSGYLRVRPYFVKKGKDAGFLFPIDPKGRGVANRVVGHMTRQRFGQCLKKLALDAGLDPVRVSPHVLRHSFASHLLARGVDLRVLQELMGHASIMSTEIYTHIKDEAMQQLVRECHPLSNVG